MEWHARCLVQGSASGPLLYSDVPLSFWGGVNTTSGGIVDEHHPLCGRVLQGHILAIPSGRGSCTGSVAILQLLLNGIGPAGLIFEHVEEILTLGVIVSQMLFERHIPIIVLQREDFAALQHYGFAAISGRSVRSENQPIDIVSPPAKKSLMARSVTLNEYDEAILAGHHGEATRVAMRILLEYAELQNAPSLIDVSQAHIDACCYTGPAGIEYAEHLLQLGGKVAVPTSMNSISVDKRQWREIGVDAEYARQAERLADAYIKMGARPTFTCTPYLLDTAPSVGEHIGWGESNAVVFANSVLGARTQKYPDFIDSCIAITGRAPAAGCHAQERRAPSLAINIPALAGHDDSVYPLLGYCIGHLCGPNIPIVLGLENANPTISDFKAFGAAFATTSSAPMFHIRGITPESGTHEGILKSLRAIEVTKDALLQTWHTLNTATDPSVKLVALGNPHFSFEEFNLLASLCSGRQRHTSTTFVVTTSRHNCEQADKSGALQILSEFGAQVLCDTCWCMVGEPIASPHGGNVMTNSGKYAHYAPGLIQRKVHFGSLEECVEAGVMGRRKEGSPSWLT